EQLDRLGAAVRPQVRDVVELGTQALGDRGNGLGGPRQAELLVQPLVEQLLDLDALRGGLGERGELAGDAGWRFDGRPVLRLGDPAENAALGDLGRQVERGAHPARHDRLAGRRRPGGIGFVRLHPADEVLARVLGVLLTEHLGLRRLGLVALVARARAHLAGGLPFDPGREGLGLLAGRLRLELLLLPRPGLEVGVGALDRSVDVERPALAGDRVGKPGLDLVLPEPPGLEARGELVDRPDALPADEPGPADVARAHLPGEVRVQTALQEDHRDTRALPSLPLELPLPARRASRCGAADLGTLADELLGGPPDGHAGRVAELGDALLDVLDAGLEAGRGAQLVAGPRLGRGALGAGEQVGALALEGFDA